MKNLKQIARMTTLTGIIILSTVAVNAGIIFERNGADQNSNPCTNNEGITSQVDGILSAIGVTEDGTVCGIIFE